MQIATTGCTTNRRLPRLVAPPVADCHDWLHDQSQIANAVCTTNCRYKKRRLVLGSEESTPSWRWCHLEYWSSYCSTCIGVGVGGGEWGGLCWGFARPLLACPPQEEPGGYLHLHSLALLQPLLLRLELTYSPFACLSFAAFVQHWSVRKLKEYCYWRLIELFIFRKVVQLVMTGRNWSHYQSWHRTTSRTTNRLTGLATTSRRSAWLVVLRPLYDPSATSCDLESPKPSFEHDRRPCYE